VLSDTLPERPAVAAGPVPPGKARAVYSARAAEESAHAARLAGIDDRISIARLAAATLGAAVLAGAALGAPWDIRWALIPAAVFTGLLIAHERVIAAGKRARRLAGIAEAGLLRLDGGWVGRGDDGLRFFPADHPYARDLDICGRGSLYERLCLARTEGGRRRLAEWLAAPALPDTIRERQEAVLELCDSDRLREDLALLADGIEEGLRRRRGGRTPEAATGGAGRPAPALPLSAWATAPSPFAGERPGTAIGLLALLCALANVVCAAGWSAGWWSWWPLAASLALSLVCSLSARRGVDRAIAGAEPASREIPLLARLLARVESEPFRSPFLVTLIEKIREGGGSPARRSARLAALFDLLAWRNNQIFLPLSWFLLWKTQCAAAIERWRRRNGPSVERWIHSVGEIEATLSCAAWLFENPEDVFPLLSETEPVFEAEGLGHPLISDDRLVRNDVTLSARCRLLVVSGSNMSGKSTLLRAVGVGTVMALAGAPVRARALTISPLQLGASIRVSDSLLEGRSLFYAEILRLRRLMEMSAQEPALLFLLDEILAGTNSHDRRIGASAVVRGLIDRGALGMVTTHDLALAEIADAMGGLGRNVHFVDVVENGGMVFDYRLHDGVVRKSNALELMRSIGLEV